MIEAIEVIAALAVLWGIGGVAIYVVLTDRDGIPITARTWGGIALGIALMLAVSSNLLNGEKTVNSEPCQYWGREPINC